METWSVPSSMGDFSQIRILIWQYVLGLGTFRVKHECGVAASTLLRITVPGLQGCAAVSSAVACVAPAVCVFVGGDLICISTVRHVFPECLECPAVSIAEGLWTWSFCSKCFFVNVCCTREIWYCVFVAFWLCCVNPVVLIIFIIVYGPVLSEWNEFD